MALVEALEAAPAGRTCQGCGLSIPMGWEVVALDAVIPRVSADMQVTFEPWLEMGWPVVPAILLSAQEPADILDGLEDEIEEDELEELEQTTPMNTWETVVDELNCALEEEFGVDPEDVEDPDVPVYCDYCKTVVAGGAMIRIRYGTLEPADRVPPGSPPSRFDPFSEGSTELMCMHCMGLIAEHFANLWEAPKQ